MKGEEEHTMHVVLWILQVLLAVIFAIAGVTHFLPPEGLPEAMRGVAEMPAGVPYFIGAVEILAVLGLILPGLTGIQTRLTPLASAGLILVMVGAIVWHAQREEFPNIVLNVILAVIAAFVAYGRWRLRPL